MVEMAIPQEKSKVKFDDVINSIGQFGWAQARIIFLASLFDILNCWMIFFFLYGGYNPGFYCLSTRAKESNVSVDDIIFLEEQAVNETTQDLWASDVCSINGTTCASILFKPGYRSTITEFSLVCDKMYVSTACTTCLMVGILFGSFTGGHLGDKYGRKRTLFGFGLPLILVFYVQALSVNWIMFAVMRFLGGFSVGGCICMAFIMPIEVIGVKLRIIAGAVGLWQISLALFSGLGFFVRDWRHLSLIAGAIVTPVMANWFLLPESPRWLIQQGRIEEATKILHDMADRNKKPRPSHATINSLERREGGSYVFKDLFRSRDLTMRSITMFSIWCSCAVTYYSLTMNVRDLASNIYLNNIIMAFIDIAIALSVIFIASRFGRKHAIIGYFSTALLSLIIAICLGMANVSRDIFAGLAVLGRGAINGSFQLAYLLSAEVFPTVIRSVAVGSCSTFARIGGILAPQISFLVHVHFALPGTICGVILIIVIIMTQAFLPETKGRPLEDVLPPKVGCCSLQPEAEEEEVVHLNDDEPTV